MWDVGYWGCASEQRALTSWPDWGVVMVGVGPGGLGEAVSDELGNCDVAIVHVNSAVASDEPGGCDAANVQLSS